MACSGASSWAASSAPRADGRRLDLIAATRHDLLAEQDCRQLAGHGVRAARDGVRWHLIEPGAPGRYDWSSLLPMLRAAEAAGIQVAWDLCHYGWPDRLDVFSAAFVDRLARYAGAVPGLGHAGQAAGARPRRRAGTARRGGGEPLLGQPMGARGRPDLALRPARPPAARAPRRRARALRPPSLPGGDHIEGDLRASWLRHVAGEVREAVRRGLPVEGVCLYPGLGHPGWDDDRYCANGLFEMEPHHGGRRPVHAPLAAELRRQQRLLAIPVAGQGREAPGGGDRRTAPHSPREPPRTARADPQPGGHRAGTFRTPLPRPCRPRRPRAPRAAWAALAWCRPRSGAPSRRPARRRPAPPPRKARSRS